MSLHILEESPNTDDAFGGLPDDRSLEERLASGFILIDKPAGPTSHQLAAWARDLLGLERLGHGGTLDPFELGSPCAEYVRKAFRRDPPLDEELGWEALRGCSRVFGVVRATRFDMTAVHAARNAPGPGSRRVFS